VADLILGWEGILGEDGTPVPFSRAGLMSLLSNAPVEDVDLCVMNGDGPLRVPAGPYAGDTVGEALCRYIPKAIIEGTGAEQEALAEKKEPSKTTRSSGRGSTTGRKSARSRRTKPKSSD
jgi:hypothetical protein